MRYHIWFIMAGMFLQFHLPGIAQSPNNSRFNQITPGIEQWFPGWYITPDGDTLKGFAFLSNQIDNQQLLRFAKDNPPGMDEKKLLATQAKGFLVKDRVYESLQMNSNKSSEPAFVRRLETGRLNLYTWYNLPAQGTMHDGWYERPITVNDEKFHERVFILKMGDDLPFLVPNEKNFATVMSQVVSNDSTLSQRIAQKLKGYRSGDILNIVQEYNKHCVAH